MIITTMKLNNKQYNYYFRLFASNITALALSYSKNGIWVDKITTLSHNQTNNVIIQFFVQTYQALRAIKCHFTPYSLTLIFKRLGTFRISLQLYGSYSSQTYRISIHIKYILNMGTAFLKGTWSILWALLKNPIQFLLRDFKRFK